MAFNLKERLSLTKYYNPIHYSHRAYEVTKSPYGFIWIIEEGLYGWYFRLDERYVSLEIFLSSPLVPAEIKRIIMFNLDEAVRK